MMDNLPLNFASKPGFQFFLQQVLGEKRFAVPSEDSVAKSVLMLHESVILATKELLQKTKSVGVSLETWKIPSLDASKTKQYIAIKVHFSVNFRVYDVVLGCIPIDDIVTVDGLKSILDQYFDVSFRLSYGYVVPDLGLTRCTLVLFSVYVFY